MSEFFYGDAAALRRVIKQALPEGSHRVATLAAVDRWVTRQARCPRLVGTTAAAKILGVRPPHVSRLRDRGVMPEPIQIEDSVEVYLREDVEEVAEELRARRSLRAKRKEGAA